MSLPRLSLLIAGVILLAACSPEGEPGQAHGARLFAENCAACHGADARGNVGPDLTGLTARSGTYPRDYVRDTIAGYNSDHDTRSLMPMFGKAGPDALVLSAETAPHTLQADLDALTDFVARLQR